jgi:UDP:flavonoid glycosyltransferase YjiC (YdhE family)
VARIALVAGPDSGHALPAIGVGAELRRRGHEVRLYSGTNQRTTALRHGIDLRSLPMLGPTEGDDDLGHRMWTRAGEMAVPLADQLARWGPALVVVDTITRAGAFAAQRLGLPWVELVPHYLDDPADDLPPVGLGRRPARSPWRRADDRRLVGLQRRSIAVGAAQAAAVAAQLGLAEVAPPVLRLVGTLPAFERPRAVWPADAHVVGPLAAEPELPELEPPDGDEPLVVVTDSTATGLDRGIAATAIQALARTDLRVVVTSGRLPAYRGSRLVVGAGPHAPLLRDAAVAVGPGGAGFISKAATAGVPMVVVPLMGDQREEAARLRDAGMGVTIRPRHLTPRRLRWAIVRQVVDRDAHDAAAKLAEQAAQLGPSVAVDLIESVLAGSLPPSTGPDQHLGRLAGTGAGRSARWSPGRRPPGR